MKQNEYIQLRGVGRVTLSELQWIFESYQSGCDCELCSLLEMQKEFNIIREQKESEASIKRQFEEEERRMNESDD